MSSSEWLHDSPFLNSIQFNIPRNFRLEADASYRTVKNLLENPLVVDEASPDLSAAGAMLHGAAALLEGVL